MRTIGKLYTFSGLSLIIGIVVIEILSVYFPFFGILGMLLWYATYIFLFIFSLRCLKNLIFGVFRKTSIISLLLILLSVILIFTQINNPAALSGETTIETECALTHIYEADDMGYRKTCLFGYPARQYYLSVLPSIVVGRSLAALNFGGSLYFLLGIVIFTHGIFSYYGFKKKTDYLASLAIASLFHFHYFNHFLFIFEQSIFPLSMGLILVGGFLEYKKSYNNIAVVPIGISLFYLTSSYTTSLALFGLAIIILSSLLITKLKGSLSRAILLLVIIGSITVLISGLLYRNDININEESRTKTVVVEDLSKSFKHLLTGDLPFPYTSAVFRYIFVGVIAVSFFGLAGYSGIIMSVWIIEVIIFSVVSKGYYFYALEFRLHRALVALPVFLYLLTYLANRLSTFKYGVKIVIAFSFLIITSGLYYNQKFLNNRSPNPQFAYIEWLKTNIDTKQPSNLYITHEAGRFNGLISLSDTLRYFIPNLEALYTPTEDIFEYNCTPLNRINGMVLIPKVHRCYYPLVNLTATSPNVTNLGSFKSRPDMDLILFRIE